MAALDDSELASYARGMAGALGAIGPTSREHVLGMLVALHLGASEAQAVIEYALAHRILVADGETLRVASPHGGA